MRNPEYVGDGVYSLLQEDGTVKLMTGSHNNPAQVIWLEPKVWNSLLRWKKGMENEQISKPSRMEDK